MMRATLPILMLLCILLAGCASLGREGPNTNYDAERAKYFEGSEGVVASFQNFPTKLYYYGPGDPAANEFTFGVEMRNQGASFSRGGVYVSGFDPRLIVCEEIPITAGAVGACGFSLGTVGFGQFGGIFRCDGVSGAYGGDYFQFSSRGLLTALSALTERFGGKAWWDASKFDFGVDYERTEYGENFIVNVNGVSGHVEYYQHGRLFIAVFAGLDFIKNGGREFLLAGDTYEYPGGEYAYFTYNCRVVNWPVGLDETTQKFLLTTAYQYTTFASPIMCFDPEPYSETRKVCRPQSKRYSGGNGGPVAITAIEHEATPRKNIYHILVEDLRKRERGSLNTQLYDAGKLEKASPYYPGRVTSADLNVVYLGDVRRGDHSLSPGGGPGGIICNPHVIRLDPSTGKGQTTCTDDIDFNVNSAYQAPLVVELWYGYVETQEQSVTIKRIV